MPKLLVIDSAYTFEILKSRKIEHLVTAKDLEGFFEKVWTCHPVSTILLPNKDKKKFGKPSFSRLNDRNTFIIGKIGLLYFLRKIPVLNFLLSQLYLIHFLTNLINSEDIQYIRAEDAHYNGFLAWILSRRTKRPFLVGVWGNPDAIRARTKRPITPRLFGFIFIERYIENFILARCHFAMVQNIENKTFLQKKGLGEQKIKILRFGNLIDPIHFLSSGERKKWPSTSVGLEKVRGPKILVLSRLEELKLVQDVLYAINQEKFEGIEYKLFFVGDGALRVHMEQYVLNHGLTDRIIFCGNKDQKWIAKALDEVDFVVSPLTGRALAEVALAGKPVVAYDIDWHGELVETNQTGYLVKALDVDSLSSAIYCMVHQSSNYLTMGTLIRQKALSLLDVNENIDSEKKMYQSISI